MESNEIISIINTFTEHPRCFSQEEILQFTWKDEEDLPTIIGTLKNNPQFICTKEEPTGRTCFISRKALHRWYVRLNIRLAISQEARLSESKLALLMSSLRQDSQWNIPPPEYIKQGQSLSLIHLSWNPNEYVFPLAYVFSFIPSTRLKIVRDLFYSFSEIQQSEQVSDKMILDSTEKILAMISPRESYILRMRERLSNNQTMTLEQIGQTLGLSRERIRQIETKAWRRIYHPTKREIVTTALVYGLIHQNGSLLLDLDSTIGRLLAFIVKCNQIPLCIFPYTNVAIIGIEKEKILLPQNINWFSSNLNEIASGIAASNKIPIKSNDFLTLAKGIQKAPRFTKLQRVYHALKQIDRPAHYSEIAEMYNILFPHDISSEHAIHAILLREQLGIVWIGKKGTFALTEWGYKRPSKTIFDTVSEIVEQRYATTGKPVPFNVIVAEVGKYRKAVQLTSIVFASHCNSRVERVGGDSFIPVTGSEEEEKDMSKEELDKILQEFERRVKRRRMTNKMTYERALQIANEALKAYEQAKTKEDIEEIFIKYGRRGIGYRPLCRIFFSEMAPELAVKVYKRE